MEGAGISGRLARIFEVKRDAINVPRALVTIGMFFIVLLVVVLVGAEKYFEGHAITHALVVLAIYLIAGGLLVSAVRHRRSSAAEAEVEAAAAGAVVV